MGEKVFENNNVYFPAFIKPVIGLMLFAAIGLVSSNRFFIKDDTQKLNLQNMLIVLAAALVIGAIMGIVAMLKIPKMKITVNKKGVEVIRGKAEGFYPLKDFRGYKTTRRQKNEFGTLIFEDEDDTDDQYLLIDCEGFRWGDFKKIADCIRIFKYNVFHDGDYPTDKLEDDHYEGSDKEVYDPKKSRNQLIIGIIIQTGHEVINVMSLCDMGAKLLADQLSAELTTISVKEFQVLANHPVQLSNPYQTIIHTDTGTFISFFIVDLRLYHALRLPMHCIAHGLSFL